MTTEPRIGSYDTEFLAKHNIEFSSVDLCPEVGSSLYRKIWVIRLERADAARHLCSFTWLYTQTFRGDELDWDETLWWLSLSALQGTQSFDGYVHDELGETSDLSVRPSDYADWIHATHLWHQIREFLSWDDALIAEFFHILRPPHRTHTYPFTERPVHEGAAQGRIGESGERRSRWIQLPNWLRRHPPTPGQRHRRRDTGPSEATR
ncbi:hypothetical protein VA596_47285 [Amycolatopsis sp., V23-08]|uniref:DUF4240 domain-containing protein n=1 Tax=Amycolatopsis heterodermiae TaxID=3110235 RepID=A0ABU5RLY4_9PSEU|nr:hypothetical protein [Amycolatopsis sp., V23-08]MEA5367203.1 hypothetical protein [Amycolatopsis sp., V23-08]